MKFFVIVLAVCFLASCSEQELAPKPKGYNRIELPEHKYQLLGNELPYQFKHSVHSKVLKDSSWLSEPTWIDIYYPEHKCNIQITYKKFEAKNSKFDELVDDAHKLTNKHNVKAYAIDEYISKNPKGYHVTEFELEGEVPSQYQFYVTDSSKHFLRGALYFRTAVKNDSLAPVIDYMKEDAKMIISSLNFKE